jgi:hypothetical protein
MANPAATRLAKESCLHGLHHNILIALHCNCGTFCRYKSSKSDPCWKVASKKVLRGAQIPKI